jgi:NAD(P)-dependent dehydrogenase (short-subunit alcohol dehydrogenase family)
MHAAADEVQHRLGGTDLLVCNAGVGSVGTVADHSDEEWHDVWDVNVVGIARTVTAFLPQLRRSTSASIVCTSSVAANIGLVQRAIYSATKGAVSALTMSMAADLITDGIRVNAVCPGTADTPWIGRLLDAAPDPDAARAALVARQPMLRLGRAEEIADAIVYLSGPQAGFVTGTMLNIDGGMVGMRVQR